LEVDQRNGREPSKFPKYPFYHLLDLVVQIYPLSFDISPHISWKSFLCPSYLNPSFLPDCMHAYRNQLVSQRGNLYARALAQE